MKIINSSEFYARYPQYPNIESLKKADVLIMPNLDGCFPLEQGIFKNTSLLNQINLQFYSEEPEHPHWRLKESADLNDFIIFGKLVVSNIPTIILLLKYLQERKKEREIPNKKIIITFLINVNPERLGEFSYDERIDSLEKKIKQLEDDIWMYQHVKK